MIVKDRGMRGLLRSGWDALARRRIPQVAWDDSRAGCGEGRCDGLAANGARDGVALLHQRRQERPPV